MRSGSKPKIDSPSCPRDSKKTGMEHGTIPVQELSKCAWARSVGRHDYRVDDVNNSVSGGDVCFGDEGVVDLDRTIGDDDRGI